MELDFNDVGKHDIDDAIAALKNEVADFEHAELAFANVLRAAENKENLRAQNRDAAVLEIAENVKYNAECINDIYKELKNANEQVHKIQADLEDERKRSEKAERRNKIFSVLVAALGAALSVWISTWVN